MAALNFGFTRQEIEEILIQNSVFQGFRIMNAAEILSEVYEKFRANKASKANEATIKFLSYPNGLFDVRVGGGLIFAIFGLVFYVNRVVLRVPWFGSWSRVACGFLGLFSFRFRIHSRERILGSGLCVMAIAVVSLPFAFTSGGIFLWPLRRYGFQFVGRL